MPIEGLIRDAILSRSHYHNGEWVIAPSELKPILTAIVQAAEVQCEACPFRQDIEAMKSGGAIAMFP